ncbi:hypothetical protein SISSUDRAFT_1047465 [Sistotremastrum suecicum HHB10207 ss-3]|uniref:Uncharacterized protein n=1 Tax=Sistotremastrum suecicum HHB10207 ss-3 TaxID=1314776 RepID=A0A166D3Y2_9AGAM|nr:hypothetical protein SISSUDRAFT_1047465 [Sistotremastrum suecicum HHB10207 ss-3]
MKNWYCPERCSLLLYVLPSLWIDIGTLVSCILFCSVTCHWHPRCHYPTILVFRGFFIESLSNYRSLTFRAHQVRSLDVDSCSIRLVRGFERLSEHSALTAHDSTGTIGYYEALLRLLVDSLGLWVRGHGSISTCLQRYDATPSSS